MHVWRLLKYEYNIANLCEKSKNFTRFHYRFMKKIEKYKHLIVAKEGLSSVTNETRMMWPSKNFLLYQRTII